MINYSMDKGIYKFRGNGDERVVSELEQLHNRAVMEPLEGKIFHKQK